MVFGLSADADAITNKKNVTIASITQPNHYPLTGSLPWSEDAQDQRRFRAILGLMLFALVLVGGIVPLIDLPEQDRKEAEKIPPQLARFIKEKPTPPPPVIAPKPELKPEVKPEPATKPVVDVPKVQPIPKPKPVVVPPPVKPPESALTQDAKAIQNAREVARNSGILAMQSELSSMQAELNLSALTANSSSSSAQRKAASAQSVDKNAVTQGSGALVAQSVATTNTSALKGSADATLTETADEAALAAAEAARAASRQRDPAGIQRVMAGLKRAFFALYNRALRNDPFLEGALVLEIVIQPDGSVSSCKIVSSELNNPALEKKIIQRMKLAKFDAENVVPITQQVPLNFTPG
jgi:TonB family protein